MRKIIHVDMDAFYASIEQRDHPEYRGKPLAVGRAAERGVVAAASYEARKRGVYSAMPSLSALARCPDIIFAPARFDVYREVSSQIREIFLEYTDLVEPLSLDEAYLDVTDNKFGIRSATLIAEEIRGRIKNVTRLTASAGVSINKFLAKVASDYNKPDGMFVIPPNEAERFTETLKIEQFWGVGRVTAKKMHEFGIHTGSDLKRFGEAELIRLFGKTGRMYYLFSRGIDYREVTQERVRKSLGAENTFLSDSCDWDELVKRLWGITQETWRRISKSCFFGRTVTLKIKYANFCDVTKRKTFSKPVEDMNVFWRVARELLSSIKFDEDNKIRLMGLTVSNADEQEGGNHGFRQLLLDFEEDKKT
ncbi:MAG: DNA polymerase IV [Synergistaceae bacterium]|jgi:DNA polymerase-4|nr:DNA polymerase IV [Synergistaceae bacterium]